MIKILRIVFGIYPAKVRNVKSQETWYGLSIPPIFITVRKGSMRRLCFYTCLSVPGGWVGLPQCMLGYQPLLARQTPLTGKADPPWLARQTSLAGKADPPWQGNPPARQTPLRSACWEIRSTSGRYASYWNAILVHNIIFLSFQS